MTRPIVSTLLAACAALALASPAHGATFTFSNPEPIAIPDSGSATPYPSTLEVSGLSGAVTDVDLRLEGLAHSCLSDVDIALVPANAAFGAVVMSDVSSCQQQQPPTAKNVTLDDDAPAGAPTLDGPDPEVTARPYNDDPHADPFSSDPYPAPAPTILPQPSIGFGGDPNGTWSLYVVDDFAGDSGAISGGWSLSISTAAPPPPTETFSDSTPIAVPDSGASDPYPSTIDVSGMAGTATDVDLRLEGLAHSFPADLDIALQPPGSTMGAVVMSDLSSGAVTSKDVILDEDASAAPNLDGPEPEVTGRPYNDDPHADPGSSDPYPAPAPTILPQPSIGFGGDPNGTWSLYVVDDFEGDSGAITGGWSLTIETNLPPTNTAAPEVAGNAIAGETLTWTAGAWSGHPEPRVERQWHSCESSGADPCVPEPIAGETGPTYELRPDDVGATVYLAETATSALGTTTQNSNSVGPVLPAEATTDPGPGDGGDGSSGEGGSPGGGSGGGGDAGGGSAAAPLVAAFRLSPRTFRAAARGGSVRSALRKVGTTVTYELDRAATASFAVRRQVRGRRMRGRCRRAARRGPRCTRWLNVSGSFTHSGEAGANSFVFSGRVGGRTLVPGSYRLLMSTAADGAASPLRSLPFRVLRPRRR